MSQLKAHPRRVLGAAAAAALLAALLLGLTPITLDGPRYQTVNCGSALIGRTPNTASLNDNLNATWTCDARRAPRRAITFVLLFITAGLVVAAIAVPTPQSRQRVRGGPSF